MTNLTKESLLALEHEVWDALCEQRGARMHRLKPL